MNERDDIERTQTQSRSIRESTGSTASTGGTDEGFLPEERMESLREEWSDIQTSFVDDPRSAVQQAHELVTSMVDDLIDTFGRERATLEGQWSKGGQADTETLRVALQRYRSFFNRLLGTSATGGT